MHEMMVQREVEVQLHSFWTSELNEMSNLTSRPLYLRVKRPCWE